MKGFIELTTEHDSKFVINTSRIEHFAPDLLSEHKNLTAVKLIGVNSLMFVQETYEFIKGRL